MLSASFTPTTLTVTTNTTVSFINNSGLAHDVNFDGTRPAGVADIPVHSTGTNSRTFTTVGRFAFHCSQHAGMNGEIVVN
jgi:plastocyanin